MLKRHFDAIEVNKIINHPSIFPFVKGTHTEPFDLSKIVKNKEHVFLVGEYGCVFFIKHQPGIYEFHTSVLPEGRGKWMIDGAKYAFRWMFCNTDAVELLTKCPDGNLASKAGARAVGCSMLFRTGNIWPDNGVLVPVDVWSIVLQNWVKNDDYITNVGKEFHNSLDNKYKILGKIDLHSEDETHNRYVGCAVEMIRGGQPLKAISCYNRWAIMSGYKKIYMVSSEPLVIDIQEVRLRIIGNDFEVISCQQAEQIL